MNTCANIPADMELCCKADIMWNRLLIAGVWVNRVKTENHPPTPLDALLACLTPSTSESQGLHTASLIKCPGPFSDGFCINSIPPLGAGLVRKAL